MNKQFLLATNLGLRFLDSSSKDKILVKLCELYLDEKNIIYLARNTI